MNDIFFISPGMPFYTVADMYFIIKAFFTNKINDFPFLALNLKGMKKKNKKINQLNLRHVGTVEDHEPSDIQ